MHLGMSKSLSACLFVLTYFEKHIQVCLNPLQCFLRYAMLYSICAGVFSLYGIHICTETYTKDNLGSLVSRCNSMTGDGHHHCTHLFILMGGYVEI